MTRLFFLFLTLAATLPAQTRNANINGGRRGFLVGIHPHDLLRVLQPTPVNVALED